MIRMRVLHDDASTAARRSLAGFRAAPKAILAAFCVFFVDKVLWLDGHVDDVWSIMVEL